MNRPMSPVMAPPLPLSTRTSVSDHLVRPQNPRLIVNLIFILFPKLPIELRLLIWEMALPGPRCLDVFERVEETWVRATPGTPSTPIFWFPSPHNNKSPAILFTSREAREVALKYYQLVRLGRPQIYEKSFYFDPRKDILFCTIWASCPDAIKGIARMISNIRKLAMTADDIWSLIHAVEELKLLTDLEELMALPWLTNTRPKGYSVFQDMDEQAWDSGIVHDGRPLDSAYLTIRGWMDLYLWRLDQKENKGTHEARVVPKLRIGKFIKGD